MKEKSLGPISKAAERPALPLAEKRGSDPISFRIDEVLDSRTCPVCREMDGTVYSVEQGLNHAMSIMTNDDPDSMRFIAPWPKQDKNSVVQLSRMSPGEKSEAGLALPPYHPLCRGIVSKTGSTVLDDAGFTAERQAALLAGITSGLGAGLFGDESEEDSQ